MKQNIKATIFGICGGALFAAGVAYGDAFKPFDAYQPSQSVSTKKEAAAAPVADNRRGIFGIWERDGHLVVEARTLAAETGVKQGDVLTHVCNASKEAWLRNWLDRRAPVGRIDATLTRDGQPFAVLLTPSQDAQVDFVNESNWIVKNAAGLVALDAKTHEPVQIKAGDHLASMCWPVTTTDQFVDAIGDPDNNHLVEFQLTHNGQPYQVMLPKLESNGV